MKPNRRPLALVLSLGALTSAVIACRPTAADPPAVAIAETPTVVVPLPTAPPPGAVVLFSGKAEDFPANWYRRDSKEGAAWKVDPTGVATPDGNDITSKQEFGDCYVHVEFRCPADANGNPVTSGNSGVGLMGRYEVQIFNSYGQKPEAHGSGALYDQTPPLVVASKKPGEWQTYDILFRAPRFDAAGKLTENARATVFQNGILVQDNGEFHGPTGIQYGDFKGEVPVAPLVLQGNHDPVQFRNIWVIAEP